MSLHQRASAFAQRLLLIAACGVVMSGCANFNSIYREYQPDSKRTARSAIVDVKQRAILSNTVTVDGITQNVTCAEPSPDALSVIASGLSASASSGAGKALDVAFSQSETGAFIGNRTATIQLLRDMLYRACEMYMAGGIGRDEYYQFQRRYQIMTMGLLAIEQITGTVRVNPSALTAGGAEAAARNQSLKQARDALADAMAAQTMAKSALESANKDVTEKKAAADAATGEDDKKAKKEQHAKAVEAAVGAQTDFAKADARVKLLQKEYESAQQGGISVRTGQGSGSGSTQSVSAPAAASAVAGTQPDGTVHPIVSVANTAKEIVQMIVNGAFEQEECFSRVVKSDVASQHCFEKNVRQASSASARCDGLKGNAQLSCLAESVPAGMTVKQFFSTEVLQDLADPTRRVVGAPPPESVRETVKAVIPNPTFDQLRYDVFAVEGMEKEQKQIANAIRELGVTSVRERSLKPAECSAERYNVVGGHSIRYDATEDSEKQALAKLKPIVAKALGKSETEVNARPVAKPTPLYVSVLLCGKQ